MDWQHFYDGDWLFPIKVKLVLAVILIMLVLNSELLVHKKGTGSGWVLLNYTPSFAVVELWDISALIWYTASGRWRSGTSVADAIMATTISINRRAQQPDADPGGNYRKQQPFFIMTDVAQ